MKAPENYQKRLFPYAYNILGSAEDAKDIVQDVIIKFVTIQKEELENEMSYLVRMVINSAINLKIKNKKVTKNNTWLPEPIAPNSTDDGINNEDIASYSILVMLEYLNPKERAVFILKEAFDYSHEDIAKTLSIAVENSRKLLSRAKKSLKGNKKKSVSVSKETISFLQNYIDAIKNGDLTMLEKMLSKEILVRTDGGSEVKIISALTYGIKQVAALMLTVYNTYQKGLTIVLSKVNHQPALLFYNGDQLVNCQVYEIEISLDKNQLPRSRHERYLSANKEGSKEKTSTQMYIKTIYSIVDPLKLKSLK